MTVGDHCILFGSLWRRKIDKKGREIGQKQSKEAEIKLLDSLHTRSNTIEKLGLSLATNISTDSWSMFLALTTTSDSEQVD